MEKNMMPPPNDLLILILLRLPVKSLLRFRSVSKTWLSLISDPHFAKSHFDVELARTHRLMILKSSPPQTRSIDLDASLHDDSSSSAHTNLGFQLPPPNFGVQTIPSCRGFLLLWDHHSHIYLWNPSTGVHKKLPLSPAVSSMNPCSFTFLYGFGYDLSKDDYLVVLASYDSSTRDWATQFEFFSLRANSWGRIEGTLLHYMDDCDEPRAGTLLNGAIHWLAFRWRVSRNVIVAFDLVERSLSEIPLPNDLDCDDYGRCDLWVHGGLLSLCVQGFDDPVAEIWVMKEYKVRSSWTKCIDVPYDDIPNRHFLPICSTKSGDVFGVDGCAGLVKCNAKGEVVEHRSYEHGEAAANIHLIRMRAAMYTESLLSLPGGDNEQAKDE